MLAGVAPIEASSGRVVRHRLNRSGDRRLNRALHTVALVRLRDDAATRADAAAGEPRAKAHERSAAASSGRSQDSCSNSCAGTTAWT